VALSRCLICVVNMHRCSFFCATQPQPALWLLVSVLYKCFRTMGVGLSLLFRLLCHIVCACVTLMACIRGHCSCVPNKQIGTDACTHNVVMQLLFVCPYHQHMQPCRCTLMSKATLSSAAKPLIYDRTWKERNDLTDSKHKMRNVLLQTKLSHMHTDALPN
jgi:hypothetical protein